MARITGIIFSLYAIVFGLPATGTIIATTASCTYSFAPLSQIVNGTSSASCSLIGPDMSTVSAMATSGAYFVEARTHVGGQFSIIGPIAHATASYDADFIFTIFGSSGTAGVLPELFAQTFADPQATSGANAVASLGPITIAVDAPSGHQAGMTYYPELIPF